MQARELQEEMVVDEDMVPAGAEGMPAGAEGLPAGAEGLPAAGEGAPAAAGRLPAAALDLLARHQPAESVADSGKRRDAEPAELKVGSVVVNWL